jgi:diguanylate cyclase (GGDEF)-like protein/PAS domain S-box-containing protein
MKADVLPIEISLIDLEHFRQIVHALAAGVVVCDAGRPDLPVVYVNPAFEQLTGYSAVEMLGRNCRFLQGDNTQDREKAVVRQALAEGSACKVVLRNYRKDGSMFWNELSLSAVRDAEGRITHFVGLLQDVSAGIELERQLQVEKQSLEEANRKLEMLVVHDELTGLYNRMFFDSQFALQWKTAARNRETLALLYIDIANFSKINTQYGHENGNLILRKVADGLRDTFTRSSDLVVRYGGDEFVVVAASIDSDQAKSHARELREKMQNLTIPPLYTEFGYVMVNLRVGVGVHAPQPDENPEILLDKAMAALHSSRN